MVISGLCDITAAAYALLPHTATIPYRGVIDVLIIHRQYGLIVGQVKSMRANPQIAHLDKAIASKVGQAVKQLNHSADVLRQLMSGMDSVHVTKTLILPNITSGQLLQVLSTNATVAEVSGVSS